MVSDQLNPFKKTMKSVLILVVVEYGLRHMYSEEMKSGLAS